VNDLPALQLLQFTLIYLPESGISECTYQGVLRQPFVQRHGLEIADASSQAPLSTVADVPSDKQGAREKTNPVATSSKE